MGKEGAARVASTVYLHDARDMGSLPEDSVHLVVTSPPYPMIPMWDGPFERMGASSYEPMHAALDEVWDQVRRALVPGGLACIVVGDALRKVDGVFRLFPNHARVTLAFEKLGMVPLPYVLWKKPTNRPNAFLGSGFFPPNAYVTLDCEFIMPFRKGALRKLPPHDEARAASRYSKEERDLWFSQVWDLRGARQSAPGLARRTGAFPPEVPRRLIRMFSVRGDTVLDPFAGTGTTLVEAVRLKRRAVGFEIDPALKGAIARTHEEAGASCRFVGSGGNR